MMSANFKKISMVGPVRGRPLKLKQMCESAFKLADNPGDLELCLYIDNDDMATQWMAETLKEEYNVRYIYGYKLPQSYMINECVKMSTGELVQFIADDLLFIKQGWDTILRNEFAKINDGILLVYSPDGFQTDFPTHGCIHKNVANVLGYAAPPELTGVEFADTWLSDIMGKLNRKIKVEQLYEHLHPSAGKADMDMTYEAHLNQSAQIACTQQYYSLSARREEDYNKLKAFIDNHELENK